MLRGSCFPVNAYGFFRAARGMVGRSEGPGKHEKGEGSWGREREPMTQRLQYHAVGGWVPTQRWPKTVKDVPILMLGFVLLSSARRKPVRQAEREAVPASHPEAHPAQHLSGQRSSMRMPRVLGFCLSSPTAGI